MSGFFMSPLEYFRVYSKIQNYWCVNCNLNYYCSPNSKVDLKTCQFLQLLSKKYL